MPLERAEKEKRSNTKKSDSKINTINEVLKYFKLCLINKYIKGEKNGEFADVLPGAFMYRNVDVEPKEEDNKQEEAPAEEENKDAGEEDVDDDEQFID